MSTGVKVRCLNHLATPQKLVQPRSFQRIVNGERFTLHDTESGQPSGRCRHKSSASARDSGGANRQAPVPVSSPRPVRQPVKCGRDFRIAPPHHRQAIVAARPRESRVL